MDNRFSNIDVNQKVRLFNQNFKNILCNFIPHEIVTCDDRDPTWINSKIKSLIQEKNIAKKLSGYNLVRVDNPSAYRIS